MPRFVVLRHEMPLESSRASHWDLMLEVDAGLATWALDELPREGTTTQARQLAVHRKAYLDYEGPVSQNRGAVCRCDEGDYAVIAWTPHFLELELRGQNLHCKAQLQASQKAHCWTVAFSKLSN